VYQRPRAVPRAPLPLLTRDGVGPSCVGLPEGPWSTIAEFLLQRFPEVAASTWAERIARAEVLDEHGVPVTAQRPHQPHLRVFYYRSIVAEPRLPCTETILFQDDLLVVADKPHFLPVTPGGCYLQETLLVRLKRRLGIDTLAPVHRLDRATAGVVVFSVQPATRGAYAALFAQRQVSKHYEAIAPWQAALELPMTHRSRLVQDAHFMRMREAPGAPNSETRIELLEVRGGSARYGLSPVTGRKHQLRVHCAALGIPILNDLMYPQLFAQGSDDFARPLRLIAQRLTFRDPVTGQPRHFASQCVQSIEAA
jgi:tRNA pseudouridine32 synthase / 23S rRNA pseudouridine746 synthase